MYLLKLALRPWRVAFMSQMFSALAVGFLLFLCGFLFWLQSGLRPILHRLASEQVITAYVQPSYDVASEGKLMESFRALGFSPQVEIQFVTASHFVSLLKERYPDLGRELEDLGKEMDQVVPRYVTLSGILPASALARVRGIPGIESAESSKDRHQQIVGAFSALRWMTRVLMVGLVFALITGLIHLIRMNSYLHKDSLSLMRLWGAGARALAGPGMISGFFVGIMGGGVAFVGWITLGIGLTHHVRTLSVLLKGMPAAHSYLSLVLLGAGILIGVSSGWIGSWFFMRDRTRAGGLV